MGQPLASVARPFGQASVQAPLGHDGGSSGLHLQVGQPLGSISTAFGHSEAQPSVGQAPLLPPVPVPGAPPVLELWLSPPPLPPPSTFSDVPPQPARDKATIKKPEKGTLARKIMIPHELIFRR